MIEALRDRIDVVVRALHFNTRFFGELLTRMEEGIAPEEVVPSQIIFSQAQLDRLYAEIMKVDLPAPLLRRLEFFASQFEFFEPGGDQIEYKTNSVIACASRCWAPGCSRSKPCTVLKWPPAPFAGWPRSSSLWQG